LLKSEWSSNRRPTAINISSKTYAGCVGQYQRTSGPASQMGTVIPQVAMVSLVVCGLASLGMSLWWCNQSRKRVAILAGALLLTGMGTAVVKLALSQAVEVASEPSIGIRLEGGRLFAEGTGPKRQPAKRLLPPNTGELLPESQTRFFERVSGTTFRFDRDARGNVTRLTACSVGYAFVYEKVSDHPPKSVKPRRPRVAVTLDQDLLDALVGRYEFEPSASFPAEPKVRIWREGSQLLWQEVSQNAALPGAIEIYPESPTSFFTKIDAAQLAFNKDVSGEVTAVLIRIEGSPDLVGRRIASD